MTAISAAHSGKPDIKHMDRWFATTNRLRTEGTDHLLAAAEATGVSHFVAQSFASWNGMREGGWVKTEEDPLDLLAGTPANPDAGDPPPRGRGRPVDGAVLRYGGLYGPGATDDQVELVRKRQFPLVGGGAGYMSWVHVEDAATATALAVDQKATGRVQHRRRRARPGQRVAALPGGVRSAPSRRCGSPKWLARLVAGDVAVAMMTEGRGFSNAKARRELGWELRYPSWRQGFKEGLT